MAATPASRPATAFIALAAQQERCAEEAVDVHVAWSTRGAAEDPAITSVLRAIAFTPEDVSGFIEEVERGGRSPQQVAADWVAQNDDTVARWQDSQG